MINNLFEYIREYSRYGYDIDSLGLEEASPESEAERIVRLEKQLSTDLIKPDLLNCSIKIKLPEDLIKEIDREINKQIYVYERRKSEFGRNQFPEGSVKIRNVWGLIDVLQQIYSSFLYELIDKPNIELMDYQIRIIIDKFIHFDNMFIDFI